MAQTKITVDYITALTSSAAELNYVDITTLGTAQASKVLTADANIDVGAGVRNLTGTGFLQGGTILVKGTTNSITIDADNPSAYTVVLPNAAPTDADKVLKTSGGSPYSQLVWGDAGGGIASLAADTSPQLGGALDVNGQSIVSASNGDINIIPNGTGSIGLNTTGVSAYLVEIGGAFQGTIDESAGFYINPTITGAAGGSTYVTRIKGTIVEASSGTHPIAIGLAVNTPTITNAGAALTTSATLWVQGAPSGATTNYAVYVDGGVSRFDGNVGIGTGFASVNPEAVLHIQDGVPSSRLSPAGGTVAMFESGDAECYIQLTGASDATGGFRFGQAGGANDDMCIFMHPDQLDFRFAAAGSHPANHKFRFTSTGRLAVNHYSPSYSLDVQGQAKVEHSGQDYMAFLRNTDSSAPYGLHIYFTNGSYGGTTHPFLVCKNEGQSGNDMAKILSDGDFLSRSDSYGGMSDERVKQDIIEATPALPELMKMKVKEYKFVWTPEKTERGIIAQEFIADGINIPSFISILEDTHINNQGQEETVDTYTASYNKLIPWLVQAVQELNAKIDALS